MWKIIVDIDVEVQSSVDDSVVHTCTLDFRCGMDLSEIDLKYSPPTWFAQHCEMESIEWTPGAEEFDGVDHLEVYFREDLICTWTVMSQTEIY